MKMFRNSIVWLGIFFLASPILRAQDLSKYRGFSLGASLTAVLKQTEQKTADVKVIYARPSLIQELTWWPPAIPGSSYRANSVEQMLFSFCNGQLYKISVIYDTASTQGLTAGDMVKSISVKYGPATIVALESNPVLSEGYSANETILASWEDARYFFKLVRSPIAQQFGMMLFSKAINAQAELAVADAVSLAKQEKPQREADLKKKEAADLEAERLKNQAAFRP